MTKVIAWLRQQLDTDEQWARAASEPYRHADDGSTAPESGAHWEWVTGENWDPVRPDPVTMEFVEGPDGSWSANLATVEEWPVTYDLGGGKTHMRMARRTYANSIEEMDPSAAGHIIRHHPARVLRQVQAHRAILDLHYEETLPYEVSTDRCAGCNNEAWPCPTVRALASIYSDRDGYQAEWRS